MMTQETVVIHNETGLHARPASMLVEEAENYESQVQIIYNDQEINAKSIMGIMSLGINQSEEITIAAEGEDEAEAVTGLVNLITTGFGE